MPSLFIRRRSRSHSYPRRMRILFALALASYHVCEGAIYPIALEVTDTLAYIYSEGPMYSKTDRPFGDSESIVALDFVASWDFNKAKTPAMLNFVHFNEDNRAALGYKQDEYGIVKTRADLCCTEELKKQGACDTVGKVWWTRATRRLAEDNNNEAEKKPKGEVGQVDKGSAEPTDSSSDSPARKSVLLQSTKPMHITHQFDVAQTGKQYVAVVSCPLISQTMSMDIQGTITFKNPYGYLSAQRIGFLPYYGVLSGYYAILFLVFLYLCIRNCDMLLHLQYLLFGIIVISFVEAITWFVLYLDLDVGGVPVCCPLHSLAYVAVITNVLKRSVSLCLLLAVCLGYGVVRPALTKRTTGAIVFMGLVYGGLALNNDIRISHEEKTGMDWWGVPVTVMDMIFVVWIYQALNQIQADLKLARQTVKETMYRSLYKTLIIFVLLWVAFSLFLACVSRGWIAVSWRYTWVLHCFWTNTYGAMLTVICWIWAPSTAAHKYAYSFQLPSSAEEADAYERDLSLNNSEDEDDQDATADV